MKLFNLPIKTYNLSLWLKIRFLFAKTIISADVGIDYIVYCKSKRIGKTLYFLEQWEEDRDKNINGLEFDFIVYDELTKE